MFVVVVKKSVEKQIKRLPDRIYNKFVLAVDTIANNPYAHGSKKMQGYENRYRFKFDVGYRIIYLIEKDILKIVIIEVGPRQGIY